MPFVKNLKKIKIIEVSSKDKILDTQTWLAQF